MIGEWRANRSIFYSTLLPPHVCNRRAAPHFFVGDNYVMREMRLNISPVYDNELFPRPLRVLREETAPKTTLAGVAQYEGLLFCASASAASLLHSR